MFGDNTSTITNGWDPLVWIDRTKLSYILWLSYALVELRTEGESIWVNKRGKNLDILLTISDKGYEQRLKEPSSLQLIQDYILWVRPLTSLSVHLLILQIQVTPAETAEVWKQAFLGNDTSYRRAVSPVHIWFFQYVHCKNYEVARPIPPRGPADFFFHPIFRLKYMTLSQGVLVVPEYFLGENPSYFGLPDPAGSGCYVFPNFGNSLFKFAEEHNPGESFAQFLKRNERPYWFSTSSKKSKACQVIGPPHRLLKRCLRWADVMLTLRASMDVGKAEERRAPIAGYAEANPDQEMKPEIQEYLNRFGNIVEMWKFLNPTL